MTLPQFHRVCWFVAVACATLTAQQPVTTSLGNPSAPVTVAFYADFACPYSAETFFSLERLHHDHPEDVLVLFRNAPLPIHPEAEAAHRAALAAGLQGKFLAMAELIFANQKQLDDATYDRYAAQLHLDVIRFRRDRNSSLVRSMLEQDVQEDHALGIVETPVLFLNGKAFTGTQSLETLAGWTEKARAANAASATTVAVAAPVPAGTAIPADLQAAMMRSPAAVRGPANARLTLVEFTDFQCPFCRAAAGPLEEFVDAHPTEVQLVYRAFPLDFHANAQLAAEAVLAAGAQGKFWQMHDLLFTHQNAMREDDIVAYAAQLGLNVPRFKQALDSHEFAGAVAADRVLGEHAGVDGTPTFVVDGHAFSGSHTRQEWEQLLANHAPALQNSVATYDPPPDPGASADRIVLGPAEATLHLLWFTDVRSPLAPQQEALLRQLMAESDGKWNIAVKVLPLASHADGTLSAQALLAALQLGSFWPMYDALSTRRGALDRGAVLSIAAGLHLPPREFERELDLSVERVAKDADEARQRGVLGTPTVLSKNQRVDGIQSISKYRALLLSTTTTASR